MQRFNIGDFVQTTGRTLDSTGNWHRPGQRGHVTDCGPSEYDTDDFQMREQNGRTEIYLEDTQIAPGVWGDQWVDADEWLLSYGVRLADGSVVSCDQNEIEAAEDPIAKTQLALSL